MFHPARHLRRDHRTHRWRALLIIAEPFNQTRRRVVERPTDAFSFAHLRKPRMHRLSHRDRHRFAFAFPRHAQFICDFRIERKFIVCNGLHIFLLRLHASTYKTHTKILDLCARDADISRMAMSMKQRGERRRQMALEVVQGAEIAEVSLRYGVKPPTVYEAWRKYRDELQALARQQSGPEASRNGSQQATTTVV
jgi:hypothetical protein